MFEKIPIIAIPGFSEPVSCWSHLLAAACFLGLWIILAWRGRGNALRVTSLSIYAACGLYLFSMSGVYHLLEPGGAARAVFQRLDHSGIWAMIAGTFTPIHVILFRGFHRWGILAIVWSIAITGLTLEVVFFTVFPEYLSLMLYLTLGWVGLFTYLLYMKFHNEKLIRDLVIGGIAYSIGGVSEFLRWPNLISGVIGPHEVFHFFVIAGAFFHAKFIFAISRLCLRQSLTFLVKERSDGSYFVLAKGERIQFHARNFAEVQSQIVSLLASHYSQAFRPPIVRLQYQREDFLSLESGSIGLVDGDRFYK